MKVYKITKLGVGGRKLHEIDLSYGQYHDYIKFIDLMYNTSAVDDKFWYIIENYKELEMELYKEGFEFSLYNTELKLKDHDLRHRIGIRIINLLTTTRLYLDHLCHHVKSIFGKKSPEYGLIKKAKNDQYDEHFSYRFMEAVRNYAQHKSIPISLFLTNGQLSRVGIKIKDECISPYFARRDLDDRSFKRSIFKEISEDNIVVKPNVDQYISSIHQIHFLFRDLVDAVRKNAISQLSITFANFEETNGFKTDHLNLIEYDDENGEIISNEYLVKDMIERNKHLEKRVHKHMKFTS